MIRTEAEYKRALERLDHDAEVIEEQRQQLEDLDLTEAEVDHALEPMISFRDQLQEEVATYERMKRGDLESLHDLKSIGRWLIGARIARGWSLTDLAEKLDVSVQQVSRDENNEYHGISVERAQEILDVLGVRYEARIEEPIAERSEAAVD